MKVEEFIDSLSTVGDLVKKELKEEVKGELDNKLSEETWERIWERAGNLIFEEFQVSKPCEE